MADTKKCKICKEEKELSDYYISKETGRHKNVCKKCRIAGKTIDKSSGLKTCKHCGEEKPYSEYQKAGGGKWLQPYCKPCDSKRKRVHYLNNEKVLKKQKSEYYLQNREIVLAKSKQERKEKRPETLKKIKLFWENKRMPIEEKKRRKSEQDKSYRLRNAEKVKKMRKTYYDRIGLEKSKESQRRMMNDVGYRTKKRLRGRIYMALKRGIKSESTMKLLGCSIDHFKKHFESLFTDGMSWDKYLEGGIHIDHIIPCKHFDLSNPAQQKKCFHYTNIQPLWAIDNLKKGTSLIHSQCQ